MKLRLMVHKTALSRPMIRQRLLLLLQQRSLRKLRVHSCRLMMRTTLMMVIMRLILRMILMMKAKASNRMQTLMKQNMMQKIREKV